MDRGRDGPALMRRRAARRDERLACIELDGRTLDYALRRSSARRTLALRVSDCGRVVVNAPWRLSQSDIESFLRKHGDWLWQRLALARPPHVWRDGMDLPFRGAWRRLVWQPDAPPGVAEAEGQIRVGGTWEGVGEQVLAWYRRQAQASLGERLSHHAGRMGVTPPSLRLSNARTRWGSLSPQGGVSLNWRLVKMPDAVQDYVVCHELAHLRQRNHSPAFWHEVGMLYPDYPAAREHLRHMGRQYLDF